MYSRLYESIDIYIIELSGLRKLTAIKAKGLIIMLVKLNIKLSDYEWWELFIKLANYRNNEMMSKHLKSLK